MSKKRVPIIAPALAQKAVRCIRKAAAGVDALAESDLALSVVLHTVSTETELARSDVMCVLKTLAELPKHCLAEEPEEPAPRRKRRAKKKK